MKEAHSETDKSYTYTSLHIRHIIGPMHYILFFQLL